MPPLLFFRPAIAAILVAFLSPSAFAAPAQTPAAKSAKIDQYMRALSATGRFSGSVLVAKRGVPIFSHGYRDADLEWRIPNQPDTKFRIGSVTKQFTAMAIMMLAERGKLRVTDPACHYLSDCPAAWQPTTIRNLLTHTSGIPDYVEFPDFDSTEALPATPQQLVARFRDKPLQFTPGEKFHYSNSGYILLGLIIERASGMPYAQFLKQNIFAPLHMANTGYDRNAAILPHRASGYARHGDTLDNAHCIDMSVPFAAGALYSTVNDLSLWDQALYGEKLVSRKSLDEIFTPYKGMVGYGWAISTLFHRKMEHHNGGIDGFDANVARFPDDHVFIAVLSNLEGAPVDDITRDLAAIVFGEKYEIPKTRKIIKLDDALLNAPLGKYRITADIALTVTRDGDHLSGELSGSSAGKFSLSPESPTHFFSDDPPADVVFTKNAAGSITGCVVNGQYKGVKIP